MGSILSLVKATSEVKMSSPAAKFVQNQIQSHKVVIFSKSYCPYCTMAKEQFHKLNVQPQVIELENLSNCDEIQDILGGITGARSVPRCFINGKFIGGGTDVRDLYESGKLQLMLE